MAEKNESSQNIFLSLSLLLAGGLLLALIWTSVPPVATGRASSVNVTALVATSTCGNGNIDAGEQCDGVNFNGQTCVGLGFDGGSLSCNNHCQFDTSACTVPSPPPPPPAPYSAPPSGGGGGGLAPMPYEIPPAEKAQALRAADFNGDGKVNIIDLSILLYYFDQNTKANPAAARYDLNGDGKVNIVDISILLYYWR